MTEQQIEYIEKVKLPEWEGYGWGPPCRAIRELIGEIHKLKKHKPQGAKK